MGNNHYALSAVCHPAQHMEHFLCFLCGQNCGRLIKNQDLCPTTEQFDDFNSLLLSDRQLPDQCRRVYIQMKLRRPFSDLFFHFFFIEDQLTVRHVQKYIFCCRQSRDQAEMLMYHSDSHIDCMPR